MKSLTTIFAGIFFLLIASTTNAQSKTGAEYFAGKWSILVKGTPNGDAKMIFVLENKDGKIIGTVQDTTGKEISKIDNAELKDDELTVYFTAQGYDVNVALKKKDDDHVTGSLMGMFETEGERLKSPGKQ